MRNKTYFHNLCLTEKENLILTILQNKPDIRKNDFLIKMGVEVKPFRNFYRRGMTNDLGLQTETLLNNC